jgi:DNA helicase-2/ATP-dependent DNA helicase PcrA
MEEIDPGGVPGHPTEMLKSINEAIYDDYARAKFPNYELRREDLNTLINYARQFETAYDFLDQLALMTNLDSEATAARDDDEKVTLSSVHQAKGLEWKAVFVVWLTDGMFPSNRSLENESAIEEERRLLYVAITRAKDELYLTFPYMRLNAGYGERMQRPSRFLAEIPPELLEGWNVSVGY